MSEKISFEKGIEQLEEIVRKLESGSISLDESFQKYEEGVCLYKELKTILAQGEAKIAELTKGEESIYEEKDDADA